MLLEAAGAARIAGDGPPTTADERTAASEARDLILRAREGDVRAFEELMRALEKQVLCTAARILPGREDAKDAAQEVFLRFYRHLARIRPEAVRSWVYRVTVNVCRDMTRKSVRFPADNLEDHAVQEELSRAREFRADAGIERAQQRELLESALRRLPFRERSAVILRDIEGLSTEETARTMKSSLTTVRSQLSRARVKIRRYCERAVRRTG